MQEYQKSLLSIFLTKMFEFQIWLTLDKSTKHNKLIVLKQIKLEHL